METRFHAAALGALGLVPDDLENVVGQMFVRRRRDAVGYWLQLMLSMGIATMGLVLGSTAVVIGAMLIAPLMGPIVELGMALTIGSPALTVRSFVRVLGSVIAVVAGAAALTIALPFHEITPEIASRALPTALDLIIAIFVALAAVFTTVRPSSETTSAAAGTAIGIALVPPVCVMGFGVGIGDAAIAGGATLLFLTNLTAILFISVVSFWLLGFERVNAAHWEEAALAEARPGGPLYRAMVKLHSLYQAPYGRVFRVSIPIVLVGSVLMPLGKALDQVAWEVRTRTLVSRLLDQTLAMHDAVQSRVRVQRREVGVHVYLVGTPEQANVLQDDLTNRIAAGSGVVPTVRVVAVPDVTTLQRQAPATERERTSVPPAERIDEVRMLVATTIQGVWPQDQLGPVLGWQLEVQDSALLRVRVRHWGEPAGAATEEVLGRMLSGRVGAPLRVATQALPDEPVSADAADGALWLPRLMRIIDAAITVPAVNVCVTLPGDRTLRDRTLSRIADTSRGELERVPEPRRSIESQGTQWTVRLSTDPCIPPQDG